MSAPPTAMSARGLNRALRLAQRWLTAIYRLDLEIEVERFLLSPDHARRLLPPRSPRSGVLVLEEHSELWLGLYVDPEDRFDAGTIVEETSHLLCLAWHAVEGRRVTRLLLELQSEIDRYAVARLGGGDRFGHFHRFRWADWMDARTRQRYEVAHRLAHDYCRSLDRRFPDRSAVPALLDELRLFYRAPGEHKLRRARVA